MKTHCRRAERSRTGGRRREPRCGESVGEKGEEKQTQQCWLLRFSCLSPFGILGFRNCVVFLCYTYCKQLNNLK